jgi:hypothetical protein
MPRRLEVEPERVGVGEAESSEELGLSRDADRVVVGPGGHREQVPDDRTGQTSASPVGVDDQPA